MPKNSSKKTARRAAKTSKKAAPPPRPGKISPASAEDFFGDFAGGPAEDPAGGIVVADFLLPTDFPHRRGIFWWISAILVAAAVTAGAIFWQIWTLAPIPVLVLIFVGARAFRGPGIREFLVCENGLRLGRDFFPWREIDGFFVAGGPPDAAIFLEIPRRHGPVMAPLGGADPELVRELLLEEIPENPAGDEGWGRFLARTLKI